MRPQPDHMVCSQPWPEGQLLNLVLGLQLKARQVGKAYQ